MVMCFGVYCVFWYDEVGDICDCVVYEVVVVVVF